MLRLLQKALRPSRNDSLARAFSRLGRIGFWMQIAIGAIPITLMAYALIFGFERAAGTRSAFPLIHYLTIASLLGAGIHHSMVLSVHSPCRAACQSGAASIGIFRATNCMDGRHGEHTRHRILDAGDVF